MPAIVVEDLDGGVAGVAPADVAVAGEGQRATQSHEMLQHLGSRQHRECERE